MAVACFNKLSFSTQTAWLHVSYLYPMSVLNGKGARAEFTGITFARAGQNLDTGTKVVHNAPETTSYINTK